MLQISKAFLCFLKLLIYLFGCYETFFAQLTNIQIFMTPVFGTFIENNDNIDKPRCLPESGKYQGSSFFLKGFRIMSGNLTKSI